MVLRVTNNAANFLSASNLSKIRIRIASPEAEVNKGDNFEMENLVNNIKQTVQDYK